MARIICITLLLLIFQYIFLTTQIHAEFSTNQPVKGAFSNRILSFFATLSNKTAEIFEPTNQSVLSAVDTPTPTPMTILPTPAKHSYKIAVFGDSMVDTMGEVLEYLEHSLKKKYPNTEFTLYNYGQGGQNVEEGKARFLNDFNYSDRHYPSLVAVQPDILIIASFAYNPFSPHDPAKHKKLLTQLVKQAKNVSGQVYMLVEIAPLRGTFGKGPGGVNWDPDTAYEHSQNIMDNLENALQVSKILKVPVIDVYSRSWIPGSKDVEPKYVNPNDGIHPSVLGHEFTADIISSTIQLK